MWDIYIIGIAQSARDLWLLANLVLGLHPHTCSVYCKNSWHCATTLIHTLTNLAKLSMTTVLVI